MNSLLIPKLIIFVLIAIFVNCESLSEICDRFDDVDDRVYCQKLITLEYSADDIHLVDFLNLRRTLRVCSSGLDSSQTELISFSEINDSCKLCRTIIMQLNERQFCAKFMFGVRLALHGCDKFEADHRKDCTNFVRHNLATITSEFFPTADIVCKKINSC